MAASTWRRLASLVEGQVGSAIKQPAWLTHRQLKCGGSVAGVKAISISAMKKCENGSSLKAAGSGGGEIMKIENKQC